MGLIFKGSKIANVIQPEEHQEQEVQQPQIPPVQQPIQQQQEGPVGRCRITSAEVLPNGMFKFTLISNFSLGEVGQEFG